MFLLKIILSGLSVALCQFLPPVMVSIPNFDDMRSTVNTTWEPMLKQLFSQASRLASFATMGIKPDYKVNPIIIPKCRNTSFGTPLSYSDIDFVMFFQFVTEQTEEYVSYSDICDDDQTGRITSGIAYFNTYMLDEYFDYNTTLSNQRITELIIREMKNVMGFSQKMWAKMIDPVTFVDPDSSYQATGIKIMKLNKLLNQTISFADCNLEFPVVFNKRGTGFRIPSYLSPQDLQGELIGHEGVQLRSSYYSTGILFATGYYNQPNFFDITYQQIPQTRTHYCDFLKSGCKADIPKLTLDYLYCQDSNSSCTPDRQGLGVCTPIPNLPGCNQSQIAMKDKKPETCTRQINDYAQCYTYKILNSAGQIQSGPTAACFQTNLTLENGFKASVYINQSWVDVLQFSIDVIYQGNHNLSTTESNVFLLLNKYKKDCSNRGYPVYVYCFCQAGYGGNYCENKCYDSNCIFCNDQWALNQTQAHCQNCESGYQVVAQQFCKKMGNYTCPTGCLECLGPNNSSECVGCDVGFTSLKGNIQNLVRCTPTIVHCITYDYENPVYCKTCDTGFVLQNLSTQNKSRCFKEITSCQVYDFDTSEFCAGCSSSLRVSNDRQSCQSVVTDCQVYSATGDCSDCGSDYYTYPKACYKIIPYCSVDDGAGKCSSCKESFILAADKGSCFCNTGYHLGVSACYADIPHCQTYDTELGDQCKTCASNYELFGTIDAICIVSIDNCITRVEEDLNFCATCVDTYIPNSDKTKCQPKIIGCITFSGMNCAVCDSTYWVLQDQDCFWNISGCINQQHLNCLKCGPTYLEVPQENSTNLTCQPCPDLQIAINNKCFDIVEGCVTYAHLNNTCLLCERDMFLDFKNNLCLPQINGCQIRNPKQASQCIVCENNYQLINGTCSSCLIGKCQSCFNDTQCDSCVQPFSLGKNKQICETSCANQYDLTNCTQCQSATKCLACTSESYLVGGICKSCEESLAFCSSCTLNACSVCKAGAYLNTKTNYCQPCISFDANCLICVQNQCLQCQSGYIQINGVCQSCDSQLEGSLDCATPKQMIIAYTCHDGYYFSGDYEAPCISCSKYSINCSTCTNQVCTNCKDGYFLSNEVCQRCQSSCQTCNNGTACLKCPTGTVMNQDKICTTSIKNFQLSKQPPVDQAKTYVIQKQKTITQSALYPVTGTLDSNNYFCSKDQQCNLNGICQITNCLCNSGYFGARCQYSVNSSKLIQSHVSEVLQYLIKLQTVETADDFYFRVQILTIISDTSILMSSADSDQVYYLLNNFVKFGLSGSLNQNDTVQIALFTCLQQFFEGFTLNIDIKVELLHYIEQLQNMLMQSQTITQIQTPKLRQVSSSFDLKDPDQAKQFISKFQVYRLLQEDECEDTQRVLTPTISISQDLFMRIKDIQTNPYDKTNLLLAHLYQYIHIDKHQNNTLYAATTRIEFSIKGTPTSITNAAPIKIIVPKVNQRDAEIDKNYKCVSWNEQTESWDDSGILGNLTQHCQNYIVCYSTHLSDFTVIYSPQANNGNPEFDSYAVQTNAAWWLSLSWLILFLLLSLYNYGKYSLQRSTSQILAQTKVDTEKPDDQELIGAQENLSPRYEPQNTSREWMAFPLYSILCSREESSASLQIQKICLLTIQLQMFTFITAGFITINPLIRGVFIVYYLAAIILTWISNYLFGMIAVNTRVKNQVSPAFFIIWFFVFFGLSIVGVYFLWDLDGSHDGFLILGVFVEIIADLIIFDFLIAVLANKALKQSNKGGILNLVIMRGYLMIQ